MSLGRNLVLVGCLLIVVGSARAGMAQPRNAHQVPEGYWIGSQPTTAAHIDFLWEQGVRIMVSGVALTDEARDRTRRLGMERVNVWFGRRFPNHTTLLEGTRDYPPSEIFIHCMHGGDRAGALLAFMLAAREGWRADHALLAVAFPGANDVARLVELLEQRGFVITEEDRESYVGIYSGARNGGVGGLKVRGPDYRLLVTSTLEAMEAVGVEMASSDPEEEVEPALPAGIELIDAHEE